MLNVVISYIIYIRYADRTAEGDIFLTMHVQGTDTIPGGNYIYSTNPVFLAMSPAFLTMMGGFTLLPKMEQKLVYMIDSDCGNSTYTDALPSIHGWNSSSLQYQRKLAQVHERLRSVLTPPGQLTMRGDLVRLSPTAITELQGFMKPPARVLNKDVEVGLDGTVTIPDNANEVELEYVGRGAAALQVIIFSSIVAALLSGYVLVKTMQYFSRRLERRYAEVEVSFKIGMRGLPPFPNECHQRQILYDDGVAD